MSLSANNQPHFLLIGNPSDRRTHSFQAALNRLGYPSASVVSYVDLFTHDLALRDYVQSNTIIRLESPGEDIEFERLFLSLGADIPDDEGIYERFSHRQLAMMDFEHGKIRSMRQWYLGYREALQQIVARLTDVPDCQFMNDPAAITIMFDKIASHRLLQSNMISVPRRLANITSFDSLAAAMEFSCISRVFIKPAHGSSASGVVAFQTLGVRYKATTSIEIVHRDGEVHLYNSLKIRHYTDQHEIADLIDTICRQRVHVEAWIPKASLDGQVIDLRVVVINGQAQHVVVRSSRSPMTNLHLANKRGDFGVVLQRLGDDQWQRIQKTCRDVMACFPNNLYAGIDLLITPDFENHKVLEVNAFGDLLPRIEINGMDTYSAEIITSIALKM